MEEQVQGLVLQSLRYGDTSLIVKVYTLNHGLKSYLVRGVHGKSSRNRAALFQPMTYLRFIQDGKPRPNGLAYLHDPEVDYAYQSIPLVMNKSAILMYLAELLSRTLTQQERNDNLYGFIRQSLLWLDLVETGYANFPLYFTLELCRFLGFYPQGNYQPQAFFDMMEGQFVPAIPPHPYYLEQEQSVVLSQFLNQGVNETAALPMNGTQRNSLLDGILTFMRLHAPVVKGLQSHEILREVLR